MNNKPSAKLIILILLFTLIYPLVPAQASAPAESSSSGTKCFAQFEQCANSVRVSFLGSFFDFMDCELELARCIKEAIKG